MASSVGAFVGGVVVAGAVAAALYFTVGPGGMEAEMEKPMAETAADSAPAAQESHPAVPFRQAIFQNFKWHLGKLGAMAKGEMDFDAAAAQDHAEVIALLAGSIPQGFPEGSSGPDSAALPAIWEDFPGFESKANNLQIAAAALADAGDVTQDNLGGYVQEIGGACGSCHDDFRAKN
ncbi:MAG: cytochrome c [Rhodovibrionaceae bacterium]